MIMLADGLPMGAGDDQFLTECHALWTRKDTSLPPIERQLDGMLAGYLYYPEFEWPIYNVRPPDNHSLIASWRKKNGAAFVFLLEVRQQKNKDQPGYLVIAAGLPKDIQTIKGVIGAHKLNLARLETKALMRASAGKGLEDEAKTKSVERFSKVIGIFTVIVNAFSLYLRKLQIADSIIEPLQAAYQYLVMTIHFSALLLLLLIIFVSIIYSARYGCMMLRRMR